MSNRIIALLVLVLAVAVSGGPAGAVPGDTQPADLGNVADADRGESAFGPHCHFVLPASGKGPFVQIITGAAHQGHVQTGAPTGVFAATACPG